MLAALGGCATIGQQHPTKMSAVRESLIDNQPKQAMQAYQSAYSSCGSTMMVLCNLESGRLAQLNDDYDASLSHYADVIQTIATSRMEAQIQVSAILNQGVATASSDLEIPYAIPDYAMTFLYPYQALNYLGQNNLSDALVSIRQLSNAQYWVYQQRLMTGDIQKKYSRNLASDGIRSSDFNLNRSPQVRSMMQSVKSLDNAYENAFSYYLASILYEAFDTDYNNAYLSMRNASRVAPDNPYVTQTLKEMKRAFDGGSAYDQDNGRLVILYEHGFVAPRQEFSLSLYLGDLGLQKLTIPYYSANSAQGRFHDVVITAKGDGNKKTNWKGQTSLLVDTTLMASKSLSEAYPAIITREVVRLVLKSTATAVATDQAGSWGNLAGSLYSYFTAKADLRSWLMLPNNVQLYATQLPQGAYHIHAGYVDKEVTIRPGRTSLLWVVTIGRFDQPYYFEL